MNESKFITGAVGEQGQRRQPASSTREFNDKQGSKNKEEFLGARFFLAPMAGWTNLPYRRLCHRGGSEFSTTELVSARGIVYNGLEPAWRYLQIDPATEGAVAIQLFGSEPEDFVKAFEVLRAEPRLQDISAIDINMGCPVKKVCQTGAGSALMLTPLKAAAVIAALKPLCERENLLLTAKFRKAYAKNDNNAVEFALALAGAGADRLCLHARTAAQMYSGQADWSLFAEVKGALAAHGYKDLPLVANGDIKSRSDCEQIYRDSQVDAFMIGRAATGDPYIFNRIKEPDFVEPVPAEKVDDLLRCYREMSMLFGEYTTAREFRALIMPWLKGFKSATELRRQCTTLSSAQEWESFIRSLENFFGVL